MGRPALRKAVRTVSRVGRVHMPPRKKRKSSEAAADAEAANRRAGVTVGKVAAAVQRLEAAEVEAPPLGEEPPSSRHCAFCARPGNAYRKSHARWIDWKLCRVLRTPGGGVTMSPWKDLFPVMGAIGDRPAELQPRYAPELVAMQRTKWPGGDCPTPHWACWNCAKINKKHVRSVKEVSAAVKLPEAGNLAQAGSNAAFTATVLGGPLRNGRGEAAAMARVEGALARGQAMARRMLAYGPLEELSEAHKRYREAAALRPLTGQPASQPVLWTAAPAGPCRVPGLSMFGATAMR